MRRSLLTLAIGAALFQPQAYANSAAAVPAEARAVDAIASTAAAGSVLQFVRLFSWAGVQLDPSHALPFLATASPQPAPYIAAVSYQPGQPDSPESQWLRWVRSHVRSE